MFNVKVGDVIRMSSFTHVEGDGELRVTFKAPSKKHVAVFLLLGNENMNGTEPLDIEKRMNEFGWFFKEAKKKKKSLTVG